MILSVGSDLAASVLAVVNLKAIGVKHLVCKAYDEVHRDVLLRLGADQVLIPEQEFAAKLAAQMISPRLRDYIQLTDDCVIEEMAVPESWVGKTAKDYPDKDSEIDAWIAGRIARTATEPRVMLLGLRDLDEYVWGYNEAVKFYKAVELKAQYLRGEVE